MHVNVMNAPPESRNPHDAVSGWAGIPKEMTCVAEKLKLAGYATHAVGKWDVGMATPRHTPWGRGYDSFLGYFHHANGYSLVLLVLVLLALPVLPVLLVLTLMLPQVLERRAATHGHRAHQRLR